MKIWNSSRSPWWKGNIHAHTLLSDGDQFPEIVTQVYKDLGYHFLCLTDHNKCQTGENWITPETNPFAQRGGGLGVVELYRQKLGRDWVEQRIDDEGNIEVRLKSLAEFRGLFEEKNRFLLLEGVEITQSDPSIHINAYNVQSPIEPIRASSVEETIRQNVEAVNKTSRNLGRPTLAQLNHPNFRNATTAEGIAPVENLELIEVYNGFRGAVNFGSEDGVLEVGRVWDIVLTKRIAELGLGLVYATGVDDTHNYETSDSDVGRPGRGWICVSCSSLSSETIIDSIRKGHFYASNGVSINSISVDASHYTISVEAEAGVDYRIRFIGTRKGYDPSSEPFRQPDSQIVTGRTRIYSSDIGEVLAEYEGHEARYEFQGDELYVRAEVLSSRLKSNYSSEGEIERAWMQPVIPGQLA